MEKSTNFTIEVQGLSIPDEQRNKISKALNERFIELLGQLDLTTSSQKPAAAAAGGSSLIFKYRPDGGRLLNLQSVELTKVIQQIERQNNLGTEISNVTILTKNI